MSVSTTLRSGLVAALALVAVPAAAHAQTYPPPLGTYYVTAQAGAVSSGGLGAKSAGAGYVANGATSSASASLTDGKLHASVNTLPDGTPSCPWYEAVICTWGGTASATMEDIVTIDPGQTDGGLVSWSFTIDGSGDNGPAFRNGWWWGSLQYDFTVGRTPKHVPSTPIPRDGSVTQFAGTIQIDKPTQVNFFMAVSVGAFNSANANFGNTFKFQWTLPSGFTYTSASGTFMSAVPSTTPTTTTPEPATFALMAGGLAALGAVTRRRDLAARVVRR